MRTSPFHNIRLNMFGEHFQPTLKERKKAPKEVIWRSIDVARAKLAYYPHVNWHRLRYRAICIVCLLTINLVVLELN